MGATRALSAPGETAPALRIAALVALAGLLVALAARQVGSLDVGFHLRAGEHILAGNGWPRLDPFTYTVTDQRYIDTSWGYQVLLALAARLGGAAGIVALHVALVLGTFALLGLTLRLVPHDRDGVPALLLAAVLAAEMRFEARPELLSHALLAAVLYLLHRRAERRPVPLWLLPALCLIWTNGHALVVLGWIAIAVFVAGTAWRDRRLDRGLALAGAASIAVALVNPYGWRGVVFPLTLATRLDAANVFGQSIGEFASPFALGGSEQTPFSPGAPLWAFYALFALAVLSVPPLWRARRQHAALLVVPFAYLAASMLRNMPLLAIAALPGIAWSLPLGGVLRLARLGPAGARRWRGALVAATLVVAAILALRVRTDAYYIASRRPERSGWAWNRLALPVDAAEYAVRAGLTGRVLNHLNYGGYLMWALGQPVFIDGRLEVMGERFFESYREVLASPTAFEAAVRRHDVEWVIVPFRVAQRFLGRLSADPGWRLRFVDGQAAIFVRADRAAPVPLDASAERALARAAPLPSINGLPGIGEAGRPGRAARWLAGLWRRQSFPDLAHGLGLFHFLRGEPVPAAVRFAEGIRASDGAYYELYSNLGSALHRAGRHDEARRCFAVALADAPHDALTRRLHDEAVRAAGQRGTLPPG